MVIVAAVDVAAKSPPTRDGGTLDPDRKNLGDTMCPATVGVVHAIETDGPVDIVRAGWLRGSGRVRSHRRQFAADTRLVVQG